MKKVMAFILVICMTMSLCTAVPASAATSGTSGNVVTWTASEKDIGAMTGTELMQGLTMLFDNTSENEGYIMSSDNGNVKSDGQVQGAVLKYTAHTSGILTISFVGLGVGKEVRVAEIVEENGSSAVNVISKVNGSEEKKPGSVVSHVTAGKVYYIWGAGTRGVGFTGASFEASSTINNEIVAYTLDSAEFDYSTLSYGNNGVPYSTTVNGLSGYGSWSINESYADYIYSDVNGNTYEYAFSQAWRAGSGNENERSLYFLPKSECKVTVVFSGAEGRDMYISQNGNKLATGLGCGQMIAFSTEITNITAPVYIYGGPANKDLYAIIVEYYDKSTSCQIQSLSPLPQDSINLWADTILKGSITFNTNVEDGGGMIHLVDYDTDEIVQSTNPLVEENTVCFEFFTAYADCNIPCSSKLYFIVEPDIIKDNESFKGINNKDEWVIYTEFGLNRPFETFNFTNSVRNFFEDYNVEENKFSKKQNPYEIRSPEIKNKIIEVLGKSDYKFHTSKRKSFGGVCFGMSLITALNKAGSLNVKLFDDKASTLYDLKKPIVADKETPVHGTRDLINYYQLLQSILTDNLNANNIDTTWIPGSKYNDKAAAIEKVVTDSLNIYDTKIPLVLILGVSEKIEGEPPKKYLHAVTVISAKYDMDEKCFYLLVKDPNHLDLQTLKASLDYSDISFTKAPNQKVVLLKEIDVSAIDPNYLIGNSKEITDDDFVLAENVDSQDYDIVKVVAYDDFSITNDCGQTITYIDDVIGGDMEILDVDFMDSGNNAIEFIFKVAESNTYSIDSTDNRTSCTVKYNAKFISVDADNATNVMIDKEQGFLIEGANVVYDTYAVTADEQNMFSVSGTTDSYLKVSLNQDGTASLEADSLKNVLFESLYEDIEYVFDSDTNTAQITNDNNSLEVANVNIHSETTFTTKIQSTDAVFHNNTTESQNGIAVIAKYTFDGRLIDIETQALSVNANENFVINCSDENVTLKAFVWDNLNTMTPLSNTAQATIQ